MVKSNKTAKGTKRPQGTKLSVGTNSVTIVLTDSDMGLLQRGDIRIVIGNDASGRLAAGRETLVQIASVTASNSVAAASAPNPPTQNLPGTRVSASPTQVVLQKPKSLKPSSVKIEGHPASSLPKSLPAVNPSPVSKKSKVDPNIAVRSRLTKMGLMGTGSSLVDVLASLNGDVKAAISLPSYLWKEFAIANRLPGYEDAVRHREEAVRLDSTHRPSRHKKISARLTSDGVSGVASGNAGQGLRQASKVIQVLTNLEETKEAAMLPKKISEVQGPAEEGNKGGGEETSHASESTFIPDEATTLRPQSWSAVASAAKQAPHDSFSRPNGREKVVQTDQHGGRGRGRGGGH